MLPFPQGMDLDSFPPLLSLGFSSPTVDHEEPLSFGTLLACLNMALSNLGPVSATLFKLRTCRAISYVLNVQGANGEAWSQLFVDLFAIPQQMLSLLPRFYMLHYCRKEDESNLEENHGARNKKI